MKSCRIISSGTCSSRVHFVFRHTRPHYSVVIFLKQISLIFIFISKQQNKNKMRNRVYIAVIVPECPLQNRHTHVNTIIILCRSAACSSHCAPITIVVSRCVSHCSCYNTFSNLMHVVHVYIVWSDDYFCYLLFFSIRWHFSYLHSCHPEACLYTFSEIRLVVGFGNDELIATKVIIMTLFYYITLPVLSFWKFWVRSS
jgi:hypothetical protein